MGKCFRPLLELLVVPPLDGWWGVTLMPTPALPPAARPAAYCGWFGDVSRDELAVRLVVAEVVLGCLEVAESDLAAAEWLLVWVCRNKIDRIRLCALELLELLELLVLAADDGWRSPPIIVPWLQLARPWLTY